MIEFKNVSFSYNQLDVLNDVSFKINNGDFIGLIGDNGAGKTTLLKLILNILKPHQGEIINDFNKKSFLSQLNYSNNSSFPCNVYEILSLGVKFKPFSFLTKKDKEKINQTVKDFNLEDLLNKQLSDLSGGQQQKVRLAKCLMSNPDLLILDEPTSGIDSKAKLEFHNKLKELHANNNLTIIIVSHIKEDLLPCNKIFSIEDNKVIEKRQLW